MTTPTDTQQKQSLSQLKKRTQAVTNAQQKRNQSLENLLDQLIQRITH